MPRKANIDLAGLTAELSYKWKAHKIKVYKRVDTFDCHIRWEVNCCAGENENYKMCKQQSNGALSEMTKKKTWGTKSEAEGEREGGGRGRFLLLLVGPEHSHAYTLRSLGTFVRRPRQACLDCFHWNVRNVTDSISENYGWAAGYELNKALAVSFAFILFLIKRLKFKKKKKNPATIWMFIFFFF